MEVSVLVHVVARDVRTTTGSNLQLVKDPTGLDPWSSIGNLVKRVMGERLAELPEEDGWRIPYLGKLLEQRGEAYYQMKDTSELTELIDSLCLN